MPDNNNNDVINDILNELNNPPQAPEQPAAEELVPDTDELPAEHEAQEESVSEEPEQPYAAPPVDYAPPPRRNSSAVKRNASRNGGKKKKKKKRRNRLPGVLILTVFIFAVSICLSLVIIAFGKDMFGIGKSETTHLIVVPEGATTEEIAILLNEEGIISSPKCFQLFTKFRKTEDVYIAGEHFVRPNMAYETIIANLTTLEEEEKEPVDVMIPEGYNIFEVANRLQEMEVCSAEDFIFYFNSGGFGYEFENKLPANNTTTLKFKRMEGYVFPDTYRFTKGMDPEQVCQKIYLNFDKKMTSERYEKMEKLGLSLDRLITFASIVQKEAASPDVMSHVAGVFWNRLNNPDAETVGMLQSDPTSNYANKVIRPNMDVYDKSIIDAYDTYISSGLPPGAICNPGLDAIDAVLANMQTDDYYFVANIYTGETRFSKTQAEHDEKIAVIREEEAEYERMLAEQEAAANE